MSNPRQPADPALVDEAIKLVAALDEEYATYGHSDRYADLYDELFSWACKSPVHATLVSDIVPATCF